MNCVRRLGIVVVWTCLTGTVFADDVRLVVEQELPPAARRALDELRAALIAHGERIVDGDSAADAAKSIVIGPSAGDSAAATTARPESLSVAWSDDGRICRIRGSDERGLTYALRDAARGVEVTPKTESWTKGIAPAVEAPFLRVRNISVHLFNADCEREWFFSEEFWRFYFQRLSLSRFNRCTLTFCDQTNYLCPPYAYLVEMPEYPNVKVGDCTSEQRAQNRAMLRRIAELADEYAIDFDLGIWMQAPVEKWAAPVMVSGLPEGLELAKYCALGLRRVLEASPSVDGIQLRMNAEAGVPEDEQTAFYRPMFQAMAAFQAAQRPLSPLRLELRYKGLKQETIDAAVAEKLDVTVSTKFWAEHFGLPYHPTVVDSHYAADRYSFGTMLRKDRNYRVTYQLWTVGSQRLTLWGDPEYTARFARSCTLGGGEGFEVFAPLTNKGYGNRPGAWQVIKNPEYRVGKWEQERYWAFYLAFGRLGYNPDAKLDFWHREFRHRFGDAAEHVEKAYRAASQVLPLITAALLPSASEWYWWPEMDTGGDLETYARIQPSDPGRFMAIRRWEKTPGWRWEEWDSINSLNDEYLSGKWSGRSSIVEIAGSLGYQGNQIIKELKAASKLLNTHGNEWRITETDFTLLAGLAMFHWHKILAASYFSAFEREGTPAHLDDAKQGMKQAHRAWLQVVASTDLIYHDDLVFGVAPDSRRSKAGHHHSGHWRDRLPEIEAACLTVLGLTSNVQPRHPVDPPLSLEPGRQIDFDYVERHEPPQLVHSNVPLTIRLITPRSSSLDKKNDGPFRVFVNARPLDQTRKWKQIEMTIKSTNDAVTIWSAVVPRELIDSRFDLQYYFTSVHEPTTWVSSTFIWPWARSKSQPHEFFVVPVEAAKD